MKKIAKLSLVATLALAGATSASAAMMDDVSVSGKVYVEAIADSNKDKAKDGRSVTTADIDFDAKVTKKIDENLSATVRVQSDRETKDGDTTEDKAVTMDNVYFTYTNSGATVIAGQQDINTPNTDGEIGTGVLATYGVTKGVTLAAAYFVNNEIADVNPLGDARKASVSGSLNGTVNPLIKSSDVYAAAVLASFGPINAQLWHVGLSNVANNNTAVLGAKFGPVSAEARYATTDYVKALKSTKDGATMKVGVTADLGVASVRASYLANDKDGGALVTDASSANTIEISQLGLKNQKDATVYHLGVTVPVGKVSALVDYGMAEIGSGSSQVDASELRFRAKAAIAKNTSLLATYSIYEEDHKTGTDLENNSARLEVKYSF